MSQSTSMQVCNFSGFQDVAPVSRCGLVDFDWENGQADWMAENPMDCGERMVKQVEMQLQAYPETKTKFMVYR